MTWKRCGLTLFSGSEAPHCYNSVTLDTLTGGSHTMIEHRVWLGPKVKELDRTA